MLTINACMHAILQVIVHCFDSKHENFSSQHLLHAVGSPHISSVSVATHQAPLLLTYRTMYASMNTSATHPVFSISNPISSINQSPGENTYSFTHLFIYILRLQRPFSLLSLPLPLLESCWIPLRHLVRITNHSLISQSFHCFIDSSTPVHVPMPNATYACSLSLEETIEQYMN